MNIETAVLAEDQDFRRMASHQVWHLSYLATSALHFADHMVMAADMGSAMLEAHNENQPHLAGPQLMAPEKIARRACDLAHAMYDEINARGWITEGPHLNELIYTKKP